MYNLSLTKMGTEVEIRKIGNSLGIILPKEFTDRNKIKSKDKVVVEIVKKADLTPLWGIVKRKMSGQEFKELVKKGWE